MVDKTEMTDKEARARIKVLRTNHPDVVEVVIATVKIASPLAGPVRILGEIESVLVTKGCSVCGDTDPRHIEMHDPEASITHGAR